MSDQKDIKKTDIVYESNVSDFKSLFNTPIYEFANKKTEKLVTALYMVSDCMDTDDALKGKIRLLGVELLSDTYKLSTLSPLDKKSYISTVLIHVSELLSFIEIACTVGFISEMNTAILKKEFNNLVLNLKSNQEKDKHFTFNLSEDMFDLKEIENYSNKQSRGDWDYKGPNVKDSIKDNIKDKRTVSNTMSFINRTSPLDSNVHNHSSTNQKERNDRINKIIMIIKEKSIKGEKSGVSIKDISFSFPNCSEKTIQRDLNALVSKGQIEKIGAKRWSRYSLNN